MKPTPLQVSIEYQVTQGRGYDTQTTFTQEKSGFLGWLSAKLPEVPEERVHDTPQGLQVHLSELTMQQQAKRYDLIGTRVNFSGFRKWLYHTFRPEQKDTMGRQQATLHAQMEEYTTTAIFHLVLAER